MNSGRLKILLVDDSPFVRRAFSRVLASDPRLIVAGEAADGIQAIELCRELKPDVVLLDLQMPLLDGLGVLRVLHSEMPEIAVVVVSVAAQKGAQATLAALEAGAFDFMDKASVSLMQVHELGRELIAKIWAAADSLRQKPATCVRPAREAISLPEVVVMGASTGGPLALITLLSRLPASLPVPVVVIQHIPDSFVEALAERIGQVAELRVVAVSARMPLRAGTIYFPYGGRDFAIERRDGELVLVQRSPRPGTPHVPSVDALFLSAARVCGSRAWGVLLTGMGNDGAQGMLAIFRAGGLTIAQDEASSAVWGMPKAAIELNAARAVAPLHEISGYLSESLEAANAAVQRGA